MPAEAECVLRAQATLGECPLWDPARQVCWWVDITGGIVHRFDPRRGTGEAASAGRMVGALALAREGRLLLATEVGFATFDPSTQNLDPLDTSIELPPEVRFNDGKCDPAGRFWAGTMHLDVLPERGTLYCLHPDWTVEPKIEQVSISNGLAWDREQSTMYYIDTATRQVAAFDFDLETGMLSNQHVAIAVPEESGSPDGMTIDEEGKLWIAHYGGGCVARWDPESGEQLQVVQLPVSKVTSCTFGGPELRDLYIATARQELSPEALEEQPLAGSLFRFRTNVRGLPATPFGG
jgi:sugar lactone lactonase YvrE